MFYDVTHGMSEWLAPSGLLPILFCAGVALIALGALRTGRALAAGAGVLYLLCAFTPLGMALLHSLENRFPKPAENMSAPDGIIVLGGNATEVWVVGDDKLILSARAPRLIAAAALARQYPKARLLCSCALTAPPGALNEGEMAKAMLREQGVNPARMIFEETSRNTHENGAFASGMMHPRPGERWVLVTSALHMPRAAGVFRNEGFNIIAWPAVYTGAQSGWGFLHEPREALMVTDMAVREWAALLAYRLSAKTEALFPGP